MAEAITARARSGRADPTGPPVADTEQGDGRGSGVPANGRTEAGDPGTHAANGMAVDLREPALPEVPGLRLLEVPVDHIVPNPRQPRTVFDPEALAELASSLSEVGFLQPVVVRRIDDAPEPINDVTPRFELVAGERRWRAAAQASLAAIPVLVRETADDDLLRDALLENHRVQLNPLEEAAAYQQLLTDFRCTQEELAGRIGRSRPAVSNSLRLLRLPTAVQRRVAAGVLSAGHARALVTIEDPARADALATRVVAEGLSVRALEEIIALGDGGGGGGGEPKTTIPNRLAAAAGVGSRSALPERGRRHVGSSRYPGQGHRWWQRRAWTRQADHRVRWW